ncbi:MAG TPA: hypothetical protein VFH97_01950, partial [Gemmatimonadales bacterium]|nr:hypothetical protein [Gemmatimonadales bacterium]
SCSGPERPAATDPGLVGVWQVRHLRRESPSGRSENSNPLPGQAVFTESHYSLIWMPGETALRAFRERWLPTDAEKIQRYGEIVVNAGTYSVENDSLITLRPAISRVPEFMGGGRLLYGYRVHGDTLWLTSLDEYSYDGVQAPWATAGDRRTLTLVRVERLGGLP